MDCCPVPIAILSSRCSGDSDSLLDNRIYLDTQVTRLADLGDAMEVEMDGQGEVTCRAVFARAGVGRPTSGQ